MLKVKRIAKVMLCICVAFSMFTISYADDLITINDNKYNWVSSSFVIDDTYNNNVPYDYQIIDIMGENERYFHVDAYGFEVKLNSNITYLYIDIKLANYNIKSSFYKLNYQGLTITTQYKNSKIYRTNIKFNNDFSSYELINNTTQGFIVSYYPLILDPIYSINENHIIIEGEINPEINNTDYVVSVSNSYYYDSTNNQQDYNNKIVNIKYTEKPIIKAKYIKEEDPFISNIKNVNNNILGMINNIFLFITDKPWIILLGVTVSLISFLIYKAKSII